MLAKLRPPFTCLLDRLDKSFVQKSILAQASTLCCALLRPLLHSLFTPMGPRQPAKDASSKPQPRPWKTHLSKWLQAQFRIGLLLLTLLCTPSVKAHLGQPPHQHGVAKLNIAQTGQTLTLELQTPLDNFLGFEHSPLTAKEHEQMRALQAQLSDPNAMFVLPQAAACTLASVQLDAPILGWNPQHNSASTNPLTASTKVSPTAADTSSQPGHSHDHKAHHQHADLLASWSFVCTNPKELSHLEAPIFQRHPKFKRITVQLLSEREQNLKILHPKATRVPLLTP